MAVAECQVPTLPENGWSRNYGAHAVYVMICIQMQFMHMIICIYARYMYLSVDMSVP